MMRHGKLEMESNKKLLVVGGTGFIGSYLASEAYSRGYEVTILSLNNNKLNQNNLDVEFLFADITNLKMLSDVFLCFGLV